MVTILRSFAIPLSVVPEVPILTVGKNWLERRLLGLVSIILIGIAALSGQSVLASGTLTYGSLRFDKNSIDFGEAFRGTQLTHRFRFTNSGPGPLTIQGVHSACNCTAIEVERGRKYEPGETGFIEVTLDTSDFAGNIVKTVTVISNERLLPDRTLTLKAKVKTEIFADPPLLDFGDVRLKSGDSKVVRIKSAPGKPLEVSGLEYNEKILSAKVVREQDDWVVTVQLMPEIPPGFLKESIIVRNNSAHLPKLALPVRALVLGNIELSPGYIEFGALASSEAVQRSVTLRSTDTYKIVNMRGDMQINGQKVEQIANYLKIESQPALQDTQLINVELKNIAKQAGSVRGKLYIETTDPKQKELSVDFYALFR